MSTLWPFRLLFRVLLSRAGRRVLLGRVLDPEQLEHGRWLKADVDEFLLDVWKRASELCQIARFDELPTLGNRVMVLLAVHTVAAYQILLERGTPPQYAMQLVSDVGWDVYARLLGMTALPFRLTTTDPHKKIERTIRALTIFPFNAPGPPGYHLKIWSEDEKLFTHWFHCPPQTFVRRLVKEQGDRGELEAFYQSWCLYDWPGADLIAGDGKRGHYDRQRTLSKGDPLCDMCWHGCARSNGQRHEVFAKGDT